MSASKRSAEDELPHLVRRRKASVVSTFPSLLRSPFLNVGGTETVTLAFAVALPPVPLQETEYVVSADGETLTLPDVAPPVEKFVPVQDVAFVEDHARVEESPSVMDAGLAEREAVGGDAV